MIQAKPVKNSCVRFVGNTAFVLTTALFPAWLIGQIARDSSWLSGLCFYIPSAFLATAFLLFSLMYAIRKQRRKAILAVALALPPLVFVGLVENRFFRPRPPAQSGALRLVHWNIQGASGRSGVWEILLAKQADIYVLSEIGDGDAFRAFRETLGSRYQALVFGTMAVVGRGSLRSDGWLIDRDQAKVRSVIWEYASRSATLFVVDLPSNILVPRDPMLNQIIALVERDRPDLVVGDFNAPRRSRALSNLPSGYEHAYDSSGTGFGYTWPVPFPMYALEQCIHGSRVTPARYSLVCSLASDHCCQVFDLSLPRDEPPYPPSNRGPTLR